MERDLKVSLKLMEAKHKPACLALFNEIIAEGQTYPWDTAFSMADFERKYPAHEPYWIAVDESEQVLGFVHIHPNGPARSAHVANCGYGVSKAARGHGIGRMLVAKSIEEMQKAGYKGVQFNAVVSTNKVAIALYKSFGFEIIGIVPGGFRLGSTSDPHYVDQYIMYLELPV